MGATPERLAQLRRAIDAGSYAPDADAVGEALLAWMAPPGCFDSPTGPGRFKSPDSTVEGPVDSPRPAGDTAGHHTDHRR